MDPPKPASIAQITSTTAPLPASSPPEPQQPQQQSQQQRDQQKEQQQQQNPSAEPEAIKRFKCPHDGCSKAYSRAEHLQRHQLNHEPKEIYHCEYAGCNRNFVRQDLFSRHLERHTQQTITNGGSTTTTGHIIDPPTEPQAKRRRVGRPSLAEKDREEHASIAGATSQASPPKAAAATSNLAPRQNSWSSSMPSGGFHSIAFTPTNAGMTSGLTPRSHKSPTPGHASQAQAQAQPQQQHQHQQTQPFLPQTQSQGQSQSQSQSQSQPQLQPQNGTNSLLPNLQHRGSGSAYPGQNNIHRTSIGSLAPSGPVHMPSSTLQTQTFSDSPASTRDEFTAWLFDDLQNYYTGFGGLGAAGDLDVSQSAYSNPSGTATLDYSADTLFPTNFSDFSYGQSLLETSASPAYQITDPLISQWRRYELIELMRTYFHIGPGSDANSDKEYIFQGDLDSENHVLSLGMMHHYIASYWHHFHNQMPILHKPTFSADSSPILLVLGVLTVGASKLLEKDLSRTVVDNAQRLANFIAWNLRWQLFMDPSFHPPAQLWVLQTLVLLEMFEKRNATRALHERANIHFASTINLMRRGTAFTEDSSQHGTPQHQQPSTPHEGWNKWITAEATRRTVFAAFMLDSMHAPMFGHPPVMVVQELQLRLPCDEALWSAASPAELARVEGSFSLHGIKPLTFTQALKRTLTGRKVRTNAFGRMIINAGLSSVSWHLRQRELQMSTLGLSQATGVPGIWRATMMKAFDFWKKDFEEDLAQMRHTTFSWQSSNADWETNISADNAAVQHHFSHIAINADIVDCQVLAGARKVMGRSISASDCERVAARMSKWSKSAGARQAVFHALQLLRPHMEEPEEDRPGRTRYSARYDRVIARAWILYFSALVVWCWRFARGDTTQHGPSRPGSPSRASTPVSMLPNSSSAAAAAAPNGTAADAEATKTSDLSGILNSTEDSPETTRTGPAVSSSRAAVEVDKQVSGASRALETESAVAVDDEQLLKVMGQLELQFLESRWELLREGALRLGYAAELLRKQLLG